jgi:uncharacterized membrane protein (UPF0127 family)
MQLVSLHQNGVAVSGNINVCDSFGSRARGLIGRPPMSDILREGFLFPRCHAIHMFFMRYPIDALFFDREGKLIEIRRNLQPWRIAQCFGASSVLEVASNAEWVSLFRKGDSFSW